VLLIETLDKLTKAITEKATVLAEPTDLLLGKISPEKALTMLASYVKEYPNRKDSIECLDLIYQIAP
jgi:hypothetical protein